MIKSLYWEGITLPNKVIFLPHFYSSVQSCVAGNTVQLLDVEYQENLDFLSTNLLIVEPDYVIDVSSVAECMRDYGSHPYYYIINRCQEKSNTVPILLGNAANFFLDELIYAKDLDNIEVNNTIKKYFRLQPVELSYCKGLQEKAVEKQFFESLKLHFDNLKDIIGKLFLDKNIRKEEAILEPSFICPQLGLQGRLDFYEQKSKGISTVIELKSGKTPFGDTRNEEISINHRTQASLYQMIIQKVLGVSFATLETYICYSRCAITNHPLRLARPSMALISEALNVRNHMVLNDYKVAFGHLSAAALFDQIIPEKMVKSDYLDSKLVRQYIKPSIDHFTQYVNQASPLEKAYFFAYYEFLIQEQWMSKCGSADQRDRSLASLWAETVESKRQKGLILDGLKLIDKEIQQDYTIVHFSYTENVDGCLDFREGDIVILYPKSGDGDNATHHQVFKGSILSIDGQYLRLRLRNRQREKVLSNTFSYAIEQDVLDHNFTSQIKNIYQFLRTDKARQEIILGLKKPTISPREMTDDLSMYASEIQSLIRKINNANDLFLLVGPPGTGKTSIALKSIVQYNFMALDGDILLAAYTNRAVDEICLAIASISSHIPFVRLGSSINCPKTFVPNLLSEQVKNCANRKSVQLYLASQRIFVGTAASFAANAELLNHKHFKLAIIDEASQILDPQLLGLLCAKNNQQKLSIEKFVLIGDVKQLPAVCLQETKNFTDPLLISNGIKCGKISFFERMLRQYENEEDLVMRLNKQGRMHPDIAYFANTHFYDSILATVPLVHQSAPLQWHISYDHDHKRILSQYRQYYFPTDHSISNASRAEAILIANLTKCIWEIYQDHSVDFKSQNSIGIITPFRSQIAFIKSSIRQLNIPELNSVVIDTVERYQGSQKDIIIYGFGVYNAKQLQQVTDAVTVFEGKRIDRKLNVALTRARKQFFFVGSSYWAQQDALYKQLVDHLNFTN